jgi:hypothetical protein
MFIIDMQYCHVVCRIPWYYELKTAFVLWLILPQTRGHIYIYRHFVHPTLKKHEKNIDSALVDVQQNALSKSAAMGKQGLEAVQQYANEKELNWNIPGMASTLVKKKRTSIPSFWSARKGSSAEAMVDEITSADYLN